VVAHAAHAGEHHRVLDLQDLGQSRVDHLVPSPFSLGAALPCAARRGDSSRRWM
jgi:hypothetical protein